MEEYTREPVSYTHLDVYKRQTYTGGANRRVVHPCYQAWSYAALIRDYNEYVQDNEIGLHPCAYLHNYPRIENDPLDKEQYQDIMEETPAFTYGLSLIHI